MNERWTDDELRQVMTEQLAFMSETNNPKRFQFHRSQLYWAMRELELPFEQRSFKPEGHVATIRVKALWFQREVGLKGYFGAILSDGTPVALCSKEKWDLGPTDSLRDNWEGDVRIGDKKVYMRDISTESLKKDGLGKGSLKLTVPEKLVNLC